MNKIRKTAAGAIVLSFIAASLFSCSSSKDDESSEEPTTAVQTTEAVTEEDEEFIKAEADEAMSITWLSDYDINPAKGESRSAALEIFEDVFGGHINYIPTNADSKYDRLSEMLLAGEQVDMFPFDLDAFPEGVVRDLFDPLDPYYEELGMDTGIWDDMQEVIDMYEFRGSHYVIPYSFSNPTVLTYSRKIVQEEGLDDPYELYKQGQWTWDTFLDMMKKFVENAPEGTLRYGINGDFGRAALASSGHCVVKKENGQLVNNISDPEIVKAEELLLEIGQSGLYRDLWMEHFDTDGNILFYAKGDWALGSSNALNDDKDLMIVPFPKSPSADRYYISCEHNARMLAKNSQKGSAVATYIRCERLAETEISFKDERKQAAITARKTVEGDDKSVITSEQYDALQEFLDPTKVYPLFDFAYGMGDAMYDPISGGIMDGMENSLLRGFYNSWDFARDAWNETVSAETARFAQ